MASVQVNIRLDEAIVAELDAAAIAAGRTRAEVVREAVLHSLRAAADARAATAYEKAYGSQPETDEELDRARRTAVRLTADEPWERWW